MSDPVRRFEVAALRPIQITFLVAAIACLFQGRWWWLAGCVVGLLYVGTIGAKLHPFQTASDLAQGPVEGPAAIVESVLLTQDQRRRLVGEASTRVGILSGVALFVLLLAALQWRWYWAGPAALFGLVSIGGTLKYLFVLRTL